MVLYPNKLPESERVCSGICNMETLLEYFSHKENMDSMLHHYEL